MKYTPILTDIKNTWCENLAWVYLAQDSPEWQALVNTEMNFWVPWRRVNFLISWVIISFSGVTSPDRVIYIVVYVSLRTVAVKKSWEKSLDLYGNCNGLWKLNSYKMKQWLLISFIAYQGFKYRAYYLLSDSVIIVHENRFQWGMRNPKWRMWIG
jgi:hypothetical protein